MHLGTGFQHDSTTDRPEGERGDGAFTVQPRLAIGGKGRWRDIALDEPFNLDRTQSCEEGIAPLGLTRGFGVCYTVGPPLARDGFTGARYARVSAGA